MSRHELVDAYISGTINRRAFVRGLTALGVAAGVAASYAVALQPAAAGDIGPGFDYDYDYDYDGASPPSEHHKKKKKGKKGKKHKKTRR